MPAKKGKVTPNQKERNSRGSKLSATQVKEVVKPKLQFGVGWSIDNLNYLQATPPEKISDELYKIFGIPLNYKTQDDHPIVHLFIEYQISSYLFAQQLNNPPKELIVLAIFNDYICSVPSFSNSAESFEKWSEKALSIISKNEAFTPNELNAITTYITKNIQSSSLTYYYVLTDKEIQKMDSEGMGLFHPTVSDTKETTDTEQQQQSNKNELEEQLAAAALADKNKEEELEKEKQLAENIQTILQENFANIQAALDRRNETILTSINSTGDKKQKT
ncbi:hypothetical protein M9Y10_008119 [Tritrichomonas musculus]|uniref:Uncharacterized protein n=1 Tax=Tritrichomonas musculus TaxID=1915356 RepID=A0ABR2IY22_9EUKA